MFKLSIGEMGRGANRELGEGKTNRDVRAEPYGRVLRLLRGAG